jgi:hypothetical protein
MNFSKKLISGMGKKKEKEASWWNEEQQDLDLEAEESRDADLVPPW